MILGAAYLRCSDPRQDKSIEQQRQEILRRATADGVVIPDDLWFVDEGISGRSTKKRASYQGLIRLAEAQRDAMRGKNKKPFRRVERVYVWAFSRIARNMFDCLKAIATLDDADIEIVSLTENDTGDKSMRKLIRPILAWLAERYIEELSRNVQRGQMSQCAKGFWPHGRVSYGYEAVKYQGGSRLVVTERTRAEFETVKRIFRLAAEGGDGAKRIAERLTREGIKPPASGLHPTRPAPEAWMSRHIHYILTNQLYCGHLVEKGEVMCRDSHEAAVDDETFARIQAKRSLRFTRRNAGQGNGGDPIKKGWRGLLQPWLRCGICGSQIAVVGGGKVSGRTFLYYCSSRLQNKDTCPGISVRVEKVDALVLDAIEKQVLTPENVELLLRETVEALTSSDIDGVAAERRRLSEQIAELDRKIRLAGAQVVNGLLEEADARVIAAPLCQQRDTARLQLAALPTQRQEISTDDVDPEAFRKGVMEAWKARPVLEKREALAQVLDRVTLRPGGIHIDYSLAGYCGHGRYSPSLRFCF